MDFSAATDLDGELFFRSVILRSPPLSPIRIPDAFLSSDVITVAIKGETDKIGFCFYNLHLYRIFHHGYHNPVPGKERFQQFVLYARGSTS